MAVTENGELKFPGFERPFTSEERLRFRVICLWSLLVGGVLLVAFSSSLGVLLVRNCPSPGFCTWDNAAAESAAVNCRFLGVMAFLAGLVERVLLFLTKPKDS